MQIQIVEVHIPYGAPIHHSAITQYKDSTGKIWDKSDLIAWLNISGNSAFVRDSAGDAAFCEVVYPQGRMPYIKTRPDGIIADNLLSLPRF